MAISTKNRKNLWAKSGNRCAFCKTELFNKKETQDEFNIGEECHIISSEEKGPRHKLLENFDTLDNLILLCRNHHKEIDTLIDTYTEEVLRYMKQNHENWVKNTLNLSIQKNSKPKFLVRITSGKELLDILSATGCRTDHDEIESEEEAEFIGGVAQDFLDYLDIISLSEPYQKVQISLSLSKLLKELESKGYYLFGEKKIENWTFGSNNKQQLEVATLVIRRVESEDIIKINLDDASA
ncbi:HNH endonuclease [Flavobacterium caeni]|uniref:HNH nuclease domain-containing protein n=1 Tax=Flavobacterium caeni TaxID=490189 RepID=A0A1G5KIJ1_9FLAO|nr:HNH endonuclease [Flavobacterium caeni]SCY99868.1 hypothetical protein SAMN02927903_03303 [Flavobacterium caeni]